MLDIHGQGLGGVASPLAIQPIACLWVFNK
jgi:hypothetical protein